MSSPRITARLPFLSRIVLFVAAVASLAWCIHIVTRRLVQFLSPEAVVLLYLPALVGFVAAYAALRFDDISLRRAARELVLLGVSLVTVEVLIAFYAPDVGSAQLTRERVAHKYGLPFDTRTKSQVIAELQSQGADVFPGISREWPRLSGVRQQFPENFFPLTHASKVRVVECNESGAYVSYVTDEFGLNNPSGLISSRNLDVAILGSAFAAGHCVSIGKSFVELLRADFPHTGNFAMTGSGALSSLAVLREHIEPMKPPVVLWVLNAFMADTREEFADPVLQQYLDPTYTQHLVTRQDLIDRTWREFAVAVQFEVDRKDKVTERRAAADRFDGILYLYNLRRKLKIDQLPIEPHRVPDPANMFRCMELMKKAVESWGGKFVVVIEPLYAEVVDHQIDAPLQHDALAATLARKGISVIDAVEPIARSPDPQGFYALRIGNHLNESGNAVVANLVATQLKARFNVPPRNSTVKQKGGGAE